MRENTLKIGEEGVLRPRADRRLRVCPYPFRILRDHRQASASEEVPALSFAFGGVWAPALPGVLQVVSSHSSLDLVGYVPAANCRIRKRVGAELQQHGQGVADFAAKWLGVGSEIVRRVSRAERLMNDENALQ